MSKSDKRRRRCSEGALCPYRHEYQHNLEYFHEDDKIASASQKHSKSVPGIAFTGKGHLLGEQYPVSLQKTQNHLPSRSQRKREPSISFEENNRKRKKIKKNSADDIALGNRKKGSSSTISSKNTEVIDLCGNDDDDDDGDIQVIEESQTSSTPKLSCFGHADSDGDVFIEKIIAPNHNAKIPSIPYSHYRQDLQQQQEQMDLERAVKESERDYIIKSQNDDYEQSLCHDREKMNRKRDRLEFLKNRFESEKINNDQHFTTIAFRLPPDGKRLIKKFPRTATTKELYWFVEWVQINPENNYDIPDNFVLKQVYGGVEIPENDTLSSLGLDINGVVVVGEKF